MEWNVSETELVSSELIQCIHDGVVRIFLLSDALDGAVKCREETTPDTEVAAEDRRSHLDGGNGTDSTLAVGRVSEALDAVPDGSTDGLQSYNSQFAVTRSSLCTLASMRPAVTTVSQCLNVGMMERFLSTYTHGKGTAKVIENDPRAGVASVIHG